jgi:hypothetical protein
LYFIFQNVNELKTTHRQNIASALNLGISVQPYVVVVGNINEADSYMQYFTITDDVHFQLKNLIKKFNTQYFGEHSQAFNVMFTQHLICIFLTNLENIYPTHVCSISNGLTFIPLKL